MWKSLWGVISGSGQKKGGEGLRRDERFAVANRVTVDGQEDGRLVDLSLRGCGLAPDAGTFRIGQEIQIDIYGKYGYRIPVQGRVVSSDKEALVFGIQFTKVSLRAMEDIKTILFNAQRRNNSS